MRVEPFGVGSFVHAMKRGARGLPITKDMSDKLRFSRLLYFCNESHGDEYWERTTKELGMFQRPEIWRDREPLTRIVAWVLMPNHFHLLLEEINEGGISKFMQRLCGSMSAHHNAKYHEKGSVFQGGYKGRTIKSDSYLRQVIPYILVKNVFELYPGGYTKALREFDSAWQWGVEEFQFSSLPEYGGLRKWPSIEKGFVGEIFPDPVSFKKHAKEIILSRVGVPEELKALALE
ncbi:MAG: transposase [Patescibacteria group bacterium]